LNKCSIIIAGHLLLVKKIVRKDVIEMKKEAMKGTPERQHLEEELKDERAGSGKIRALSHYVMRKQAELMMQREQERRYSEDDEMSYWERQKITLDVTIELQYFTQDAYVYSKTIENAQTIFEPYLKMTNVNPYQTFLDDLREINREKCRK